MSKFIIQDSYFKKAKKEGLRARSAYKLKEIQERFQVIKSGDKVLDLGCAPGSFLQVISGIVGKEGFVAGIDILPTKPVPQKNVSVFTSDIRKTDIRELMVNLGIDHFDCITCDMAPNLSGIRDVDNKNIEELFQTVKDVLEDTLKRGGNLVVKSFFSNATKDATKELRSLFHKVVIFKPAASRSGSAETYFVCERKR